MLLRRRSSFELYFICCFLVAVNFTLAERTGEDSHRTMSKLFACDFEVFGKVQGVFFRKYTQKQAKSLGLNGWCMNTHGGTVKGQMQGPLQSINEMKHWLETKGSPSSRIERAVFSERKEIPEYTFKAFDVRR